MLRADRLAYYKDEREYKTLKIIPALDINTATLIKSKKPYSMASSGGADYSIRDIHLFTDVYVICTVRDTI